MNEKQKQRIESIGGNIFSSWASAQALLGIYEELIALNAELAELTTVLAHPLQTVEGPTNPIWYSPGEECEPA